VRRVYDKLEVDGKGYVIIPFESADRAGNLFRHTYRLKMTVNASKRGSDLFYYVHWR